jgi:hypothetical protein
MSLRHSSEQDNDIARWQMSVHESMVRESGAYVAHISELRCSTLSRCKSRSSKASNFSGLEADSDLFQERLGIELSAYVLYTVMTACWTWESLQHSRSYLG